MRGTVYSEQRALIIRISLRVVQVLAALMVVLAVVYLVLSLRDDDALSRQTGLLYVLALLAQAAVLTTMTIWTLRRLPARSRDTRTWCISTACLTLLAAIPMLTSPLGIVVVFVGIFLLALTLRTDRTAEPGADRAEPGAA